MDYAIIKLGNKQHVVKDGETLVVDRVSVEEGKSFAPEVLLGDAQVDAKVVAHVRGPKLRIGKYRRRTGYKRHTGFRAASSRIEISLGPRKRTAAKAAPKKEAAPTEEAAPQAEVRAAPVGLPQGYEDMTVAVIAKEAKGWSHSELESALEYEQAHAKRKGALGALEAALAKEDED
jgi:large subunit ribosomal protein L21